MLFWLLSSFTAFTVSNAVLIAPDTDDPYITVELANDPRNKNKIDGANRWRLFQDWQNFLYDWYGSFI